jgi:DNA polymerase-3 subunit delta'
MRFSEVAGHADLKQQLVQSVAEQRVPHAQLFHGPQGSGALVLALAYATYLSCQDRQEGDSCGLCPSCLKYDRLVHPDLHFVFPVFTTKSVKKDPVSDDFIAEWRNALLESPYITPNQWYSYIGMENKQGSIIKRESEEIMKKLQLKSYESDFKVMIIWMPEKMNQTASNKLLKLIEEPPPMTIFLLVPEDTGPMLPTILSRTQMIRVPRIAEQDLLDALKKKHQVSDEILKSAVKISGGNYVKAEENLMTSEDSAYQLKLFIRIMRLSYAREFQAIFEWVEEMAGLGRERQKAFLAYAIRMVRENYLLNKEQGELVRMTADESDFSKKFFPFINDRNVPLIVQELNEASVHIEVNAYARIVFLDFALKLVKLIR